MRMLFLLSFVLIACSDDDVLPVADVPPSDMQEPDDAPMDVTAEPDVHGVPAAICPTVDPQVVTFRTEDDVELEAALFAAPTPGRPAVVLFHMIPPSNNRGNYRRPFIDSLVTQCIHVINVDRRGAGGSDGVALEAYEGPGGAADARAAIEFLLAHPSAPAPARIAMVGASNGTTSLNDFVSLESPPASLAAAVLLSGGSYTENQTPMAASGLRALPVLFAYPDSEAAWNTALQEDSEPAWRFMAHTPSAHGTRMLDNEEAAAAVVAFLTEHLVGS